MPSTNATTTTSQKATRSSRIVTASVPIASTRTPSARIIRRLRLQRSAANPAGSAKSTHGRLRANPTTPALAGECVTARTSSGNAIDVVCVPRFDSSCPIWSSMKSRLRRRGTAVTR